MSDVARAQFVGPPPAPRLLLCASMPSIATRTLAARLLACLGGTLAAASCSSSDTTPTTAARLSSTAGGAAGSDTNSDAGVAGMALSDGGAGQGGADVSAGGTSGDGGAEPTSGGTAGDGDAGQGGTTTALPPQPPHPPCGPPSTQPMLHGQCCSYLECYTPEEGEPCASPKTAPICHAVGSGTCDCGDPVGPFAGTSDPTPSSHEHCYAFSLGEGVQVGACCYFVGMMTCEGRPLFVEGTQRHARAIARHDWC